MRSVYRGSCPSLLQAGHRAATQGAALKSNLSCAQPQASDIVALEVKSELPPVAHCALRPRTGSSLCHVRQPPAAFAEGSTDDAEEGSVI